MKSNLSSNPNFIKIMCARENSCVKMNVEQTTKTEFSTKSTVLITMIN